MANSFYCRACGRALPELTKYCTNCGVKPLAGTEYCFNCGGPTTGFTEICVKCGTRLMSPTGNPISSDNIVVDDSGITINWAVKQPKKPRPYGQLQQSRAAVITTFIVIVAADLLGLLLLSLAGGQTETLPSPLNTVYPGNTLFFVSAAIDIFLCIHLLRGKEWARTFILLRCIGGILWGFVAYYLQRDMGSLIMTVGVLTAVIALLVGTTTRIRIVGGSLFAVIATVVGLSWSIVGFSSGIPVTPETSIPSSFLTYVSEGFFSISYPPNWSPDMTAIPELEQTINTSLNEYNNQSQTNDVQLVFFGSNQDVGSYNLILIQIQPKSLWSLDSIVEASHQWNKANMDRYLEHSRVKTTIGGKDAIIQTCEVYDVTSSFVGSITSYVVGDQFLWSVVCLCPAENLDSNIHLFNNIVRSLRIEH